VPAIHLYQFSGQKMTTPPREKHK